METPKLRTNVIKSHYTFLVCLRSREDETITVAAESLPAARLLLPEDLVSAYLLKWEETK